MKILENKKEFIRIIIGNAKTGDSNLKPPTKSLSVEGISVEQMWEKIFDMVKKEGKKWKLKKKFYKI